MSGRGRATSRWGARARAGFSLVELLVALAILAALAGAILPALSRPSAIIELRASARTLTAALRRTRDVAITGRREARLVLDVERREFTLPGAARPRSLPGSVDIELFTARSELETTERGSIRFYPDGGSTGGRITLRASGQTRSVDVDWLTGRVRLLDGTSDTDRRPGAAT